MEDVHKWVGSMSFSSERINDTCVAKEEKFFGVGDSGKSIAMGAHTSAHTIVDYMTLHRSFHILKQTFSFVEEKKNLT